MLSIATVRMAGWRAVAVAAVTVVLAACSDNGDGALGVPSATVATAPATTTTTNPYAVPAVIDAAYVNRVLAGLDAAFGDVARDLARTKQLPDRTVERLKGIYGNLEIFNLQFGVLQVYARTAPIPLPDVPGNKRTTVQELLISQRECIYASVMRDYSAFVGRAQPARTEWVALKPLQPGTDIVGINPTGWAYVYEGSDPDGRAPSTSPCSAV